MSISKTIKTHLVTNPSEDGYKDLLLLSSCKHLVCSHGSFGPFACMFNKNENKICVMPDFAPRKDWEVKYDWEIIIKNARFIKLKP